MKNEKKIKSYFLLVAFGVLLYVVAVNYLSLLIGIRYIFAIIKPFIIGAVIAFIINVPMRSLETGMFKKMKRKKPRRILSLLTTLVLLVLVLWAVFTMILPELYSTIDSLGQRVPGVIEKVIQWGDKMAEKYPEIGGYITEAEKILSEFDWKETLSQSFQFLKNGVGGFVNTTIDIVGNVVNGVVNFGIGFVFALYILLQKEKLTSQCKQFFYAVFKEEKADEIIRVGKLTNHIFSNFLSGQVVEAIILGSMFFIAMSIFKFPYAMLVGVLIAVTALIPIFGAFIGLAVGAFLILMVDPMQALWFIIMFFVLQQIEGNLIYPNVVGNSIGLPGIWVLIAVSAGGSMFGVVGMIVFIPTVSLIYSLMREYVKKRLEEKGIDKSKWRIVYATAEGKKNLGSREKTESKNKKNEKTRKESGVSTQEVKETVNKKETEPDTAKNSEEKKDK
ncbi:MAG: AI-2E family transporter [Lachnospiraceae bacterium]|nr:AI-2E family transporter [Lachnospiraceae bacterium]